MLNDNRYSKASITLGFAICALLAVLQNGGKAPFVTTWDVYGYYVYLPGAITYGDLERFAFAEQHFDDYPISSGMYQLTEVDGKNVPIYTAGLAMVWAPGYIVAEALAWVGPWERDGLSPPYQWALVLASLGFGFFGFWCLRRVLLRYFDDKVVAAALVALLIGTNYFHYLCFEPGMPHTYLFAGHAFLLLCVDSWFRQPKTQTVVWGALCLALMCLIRPTEIIALILPVGYWLANRATFPLPRRLPGQLGLALVVGLLAILPQLLLWKANTGQWIFNAYTEAGHVFHFDGRHLPDALLSYRKGWLVYTPLMVFAVAGLWFLRNGAGRWKWPVVLLVATHIYLTFSWHMWYYASSFGARPMIHVYPELALGVAALAAWTLKRPWTKVILLLLLVACIVLNLFQTWQYRNGILPKDHTTKEIYWSIFAKTKLDRSQLISIDVPHRLQNRENYASIRLAKINIASPADLADSTQFGTIEGRSCQILTPGQEYSETVVVPLDSARARELQGAWVETSAILYASGSTFDLDRMARMVLDVTRGAEHLAWHAVRFQIFTEPGQWNTVTWEYQLPDELQAGDQLRLLIWNQSPDTIGVEELAVYVLTRTE